jgi:hypothetical protein
MKNNIKYVKRISIFVLALVVAAACVKWEEETNPPLDSASSVTLGISSVGDSSVVISLSNSSAGYVALNLYAGTGNTVPTELEDREAMLTGNVSSLDYVSIQTEAGTTYEHTFSGLIQDASYEVMGVANNADGIVSEVAVQVVNTPDNYPPMLTETDPAVGYDPVLPVDGSVTLVFDEPILYDDTKDLTFYLFYEDMDQVSGDVTVSGNTATVAVGTAVRNREYLLLSYPEGTFTDLSGNPAAEQDSYFDGAGFVGLFWRAEAMEFEATAFAPAGAYVAAGADITVTFAEGVDASSVDDGDITLVYDDGLDVLTKAVLASDLSVSGNDLIIAQSYAAPQGVEVTLNIPTDVLDIGLWNPNAEVSASWIIEHPTLQDWVGDYTIAAVSYAVPGAYDEAWVASIAANPFDVNTLLITVNGGNTFEAGFDAGAMTVTIPSGTNAGDFYGYGPTLFYLGDYNTYIDMATDITGTIVAGGTILIDELAVFLPDFDFYWDAFNTTWTPAAKKSTPRVGSLAEKASRLK